MWSYFALIAANTVMVAAGAAAPTPSAHGLTWRTTESTLNDWRGDGSAYHFFVEEPAEVGSPGKADTRRVRIVAADGETWVITLPGGVVTIRDGLLDASIASDNQLASQYLYLTSTKAGTASTAILVIFGWAFASDPGGIRLLALDRAGRPEEVFHSDTFELAGLMDFDHDGILELIGKHSLAQVHGKCCETYDPYSVYRMPNGERLHATYSLELSKAYNLAHYYGWEGPRSREDIALVRCAPGGPRLMSSKDAEALCGK